MAPTGTVEEAENVVEPIFTNNVLHIDLVCDVIFSCCNPISLLRVALTCRQARAAISSYMHYAFNINRHLMRFFPDPCAFRSLQARTGTIISGSMALQFFDRSFYPSSDLDLYTHMCHRREVGEWLIKSGYKFAPTRRQQPTFEQSIDDLGLRASNAYGLPGVCCIFDFTKRIAGRQELKVQLIVAHHNPIEVILGFHSTCVMNAISFEKAYCLFPRATLEERHSLISSTQAGASRWRAQGIAKYRKRGWRMHYKLPISEDQRNRLFGCGWRWIDDEKSWVIPLDTTGIEPPPSANLSSPPMQHDPISLSNWKILYNKGSGAIMLFTSMKDELLRYEYMLTDRNLQLYINQVLSMKKREEQCKKQLLLDSEDTTL
ncbi:hypothetical protein BKA93DRAFT_894058 [Sparassis latifolia]